MKQLIFFCFTLFFIASCEKTSDENANNNKTSPNLSFVLSHGSEVQLNNALVFDDFNLKINDFKIYLSEVYLHQNDDSTLWADIAMIDKQDNPYLVNQFYTLPEGSYDAISFGIGVKPNINDSMQPGDFAASHPLGFSASNGMHWGWETGYKFFVFDCLADTGSGVFDYPISYHVGLSELYQRVKLNMATSSDASFITIDQNIDHIFANDSLDIKTENQTHSTSNKELAIKGLSAYSAME